MATTDPVYNTTTTAAPQSKLFRWFTVPNTNLDFIRFGVKIIEVLLSFVAFVLEEVVSSCTSCGTLYFFEFVSCTAFLFTLLLLILLCTPLHLRVGITTWPTLDFLYTAVMCVLLFIASIAFITSNSGSDVEQATVAFGFLAAIAFFTDLIVFYRTRGFPFTQTTSAPAARSPDPEPEIEKLNTNGAN